MLLIFLFLPEPVPVNEVNRSASPMRVWEKIRNVTCKIQRPVAFSLYINRKSCDKKKILSHSQQTPSLFKVDSIFARHCLTNAPFNFRMRVVEKLIQMANCPVGEPSYRQTVLSANRPVGEMSCLRSFLSAKCPVGVLSVGEVSVYR